MTPQTKRLIKPCTPGGTFRPTTRGGTLLRVLEHRDGREGHGGGELGEGRDVRFGELLLSRRGGRGPEGDGERLLGELGDERRAAHRGCHDGLGGGLYDAVLLFLLLHLLGVAPEEVREVGRNLGDALVLGAGPQREK